MEEVSAVSFYFDHLFFVYSPDSDLGNMDIVALADAVQSHLMFFVIIGENRPADFQKNTIINCELRHILHGSFHTRSTQRCLR